MRSQIRQHSFTGVVVASLGLAACASSGAAGDSREGLTGSSWSELLQDGDSASIAPFKAVAGVHRPTRTCTDCALEPLAYWTFNYCDDTSTELGDENETSGVVHSAYRSVTTDCTEGVDQTAVHLDGPDDIVYSPDQSDYVFDGGLTLAAWIRPDRLVGTQTLFRKSFAGWSSFVMALQGSRAVFALRFTNGRVAGVTAPVQANRFTHVVATYDGKTATLYLDGAVAAQASAPGILAPSTGPILIGNDVFGRRFSGIIDQVWLNTLAIPADRIAQLTCARRPPSLQVTPSVSSPVEAGTVVPYSVAITNNSDATCPEDDFHWYGVMNGPLSSQQSSWTVHLAPGQTAHETISVRSLESATAGSYTFNLNAYDDTTHPQSSNLAPATYVVSGPSSCVRQPPDVVVSPVVSPPTVAGTPVTYDVSVTNRNSSSCSYNHFEIDTSLPAVLSVDMPQVFMQLAPAETAHAQFNLRTEWSAAPGAYPFDFYIYDTDTWDSVRVHPQYVVGSVGQPPPEALPIANGVLSTDAHTGILWTAADSDGSSIELDPTKACVSGTAAQIPFGANGQPDYEGAFGALLGWRFDQPISLSNNSTLEVDLSGASGLLINLKLAAVDVNGVSTEYCLQVPSSSGLAFYVTDFWSECGSRAGRSKQFDPTTLQATALEIQVATSLTQAYPFRFCVTKIDFE